MPKKRGKSKPSLDRSLRTGVRTFFENPAWWVASILFFVWFSLPKTMGIEKVVQDIFGDGLAGTIMYIISGILAVSAVLVFGAYTDDD